MTLSTLAAGGQARTAPDVSRAILFLQALFAPGDWVTFRLIETWEERGKKKSKVREEFCHTLDHVTAYDGLQLTIMGDAARRYEANYFFGVSPRPALSGSPWRPNEGSFELAAHIATVRAVWSDIDHVLPEGVGEAIEKANARMAARWPELAVGLGLPPDSPPPRLPPPSIIVRSGNGSHVYWLLDEPVIIPTPLTAPVFKTKKGDKTLMYYRDGDKAVILHDNGKRLMSPESVRVSAAVAGIAAALGGDHTQDVSRLLRVPGWLNLKNARNGAPPKPCEIFFMEPGRKYAFSTFGPWAANVPAAKKASKSPKKAAVVPGGPVAVSARALASGLSALDAEVRACESASDRSKADYALVVKAVRLGLDRQEVWDRVKDVSKFADRGEGYFERTWERASAEVSAEDEEFAELDAAVEQGAAPQAKPEIVINGRQLRDVTADAWGAIRASNDPPSLFEWGGGLARVGGREAKPLAPDDVRFVLGEVADWYKCGRDLGRSAAFPPDAVVKNVLARPDPPLPKLKGVHAAPVFAPDGRLVARPGYDAGSGIYLAEGCAAEVPPAPTPEQVLAARDALLDVLCDFPFVGQADRANAVALLLLPFCRPLIDGPTPVHVIDAPSEGTGKGLLAEVFARVATGQKARATAEPRDDAEWGKVITSALMAAPPYILIDNVTRPVHSSALAGATTARVYKDRLLGQSKMAEIPVNNVWLFTGNNVHASREMARRFVRIRLDAQVENPATRGGFRHANLTRHVEQARGSLVAACLTLVQAWVVAGRPAGRERIGSYEEWAGVLGGILAACGVPGLLGNAGDVMAEMNTSDAEYRAAVGVWRAAHGEAAITAGGLLNALDDAGVVLSALESARTDRARVVKLGFVLDNLAGRVFGRHKVERAANPQHNSKAYRLAPLPPEVARTSGTTSGDARCSGQNTSGDLPEVPELLLIPEKGKSGEANGEGVPSSREATTTSGSSVRGAESQYGHRVAPPDVVPEPHTGSASPAGRRTPAGLRLVGVRACEVESFEYVGPPERPAGAAGA